MTARAELRRVRVRVTTPGATIQALAGVDLAVEAGEVLGVVGESGAGKSTLARCLLRLLRPDDGQVLLDGDDVTTWPERRLRKRRGRMTMVFKNPAAVLNPRMTLLQLIEEPLLLHMAMPRAARRAEAERLAARVLLTPAELARRPGDMAAGRLQLVSLARAIATQPNLIVLDEPTAVLDMPGIADFLTLLDSVRRETGAAMVLIGDDLAVLRLIADRVAVLYLGAVVEQGPTADILRDPLHPYTQGLLASHLAADPAVRSRRLRLRGEPPAPQDRAPGCGFAPRCPLAEGRCRTGTPTPNLVANDRSVACVRVLEGTSRIPLPR